MELRPYQKIGVQWLIRHPRALLADEPGLGKTAQALVAAETAQTFPVLVVCPASVKTHWAGQSFDWLGRQAKIINTGKDLYDDSAAITICNYELLKVVRKRGSYHAVILDECFKVKSEAAQRTRYAHELARRARVVWGLSGSPIVNRPVELVSQLDVLGQLHLFGGKWPYINRYCNPIEREVWQPRWDPQLRKTISVKQKFLDCSGSANIAELHAKLCQYLMLRRRKSEVAQELPERMSLPLLLDLDDAGRKLYDDERRALMNWLHANSGNVRVQQAEALMRLTTMRQTAARAKMLRLTQAIEDLLESGDKIVLYAYSRCLQQDLLNYFSDRAAHILAEDSAMQRTTQIENFVRDPRLRVCVCSLMATAIGTDGLQHAARYAVFCDLGNEAEIHSQAIDRLHRIGQSRDVTVYYAIANDTIETEMMDKLVTKHAITSIVADGRVVRKLLEAA
jgi:SWI/SNF-related matrix-associated actin-dependent regulator 1 of chromatin subfamily A